MTRTPSLESRLVRAILGRERASVLDTDAYKLSMAQAGFPLRRESFYLTFRREGQWFNPFDLAEVLRLFRPLHPDLKERGFLQTWGYGLTPAMEKALDAEMDIYAVPKGQWFAPREPIARVTSSSLLASWLEPLALMLHYPLQLATEMKAGAVCFPTTCEDEAEIVRIVWEALGMDDEPQILVDPAKYTKNVLSTVEDLSIALGGETERAFEVGMRSATCIQQHRLALQACKRGGIERTSNLYLAYELNMIPVGTTGHEHQMRFDSDLDAFRAIRDTRPETPSYLFDTYDPLNIGIPAIMRVVLEDPDQRFTMRFDDYKGQEPQFEKLWAFTQEHAPHGNYIFEDGYDTEKTHRNEVFLYKHEFPRSQAWYGYGGFIVAKPAFSELTRDKVSAAWKLCETAGEGRMKFSGSPGKESLPGRLMTFVRVNDPTIRMVAQVGEHPPEGFARFDFPGIYTLADYDPRDITLTLSPRTSQMVQECTARRDAMYTTHPHRSK